MKDTKYLLTLEAAVILNKLHCIDLIKDIGQLYITEEHYLLLKTQNKKYFFPLSIDRNGEENNELPSSDYKQLKDIKSVMHHYHYVLDIICHSGYGKCKQIWNILYECIEKYKTSLPPKCIQNNDNNSNSLSSYNSDKKLCLKAKFTAIDDEHIQELIPKEYDKILENSEYGKLFNFINRLNV